MNWITDNECHYISVWPDFVIKYNPLSIDLIEYLAKKVRKGEDICLEDYIKDPDLLVECEDIIHNYCQILELTCKYRTFSASINANFTITHSSILPVEYDRMFLNECRYPKLYLLIKTGQAYLGSSDRVLSSLNRKLNFLR